MVDLPMNFRGITKPFYPIDMMDFIGTHYMYGSLA